MAGRLPGATGRRKAATGRDISEIAGRGEHVPNATTRRPVTATWLLPSRDEVRVRGIKVLSNVRHFGAYQESFSATKPTGGQREDGTESGATNTARAKPGFAGGMATTAAT